MIRPVGPADAEAICAIYNYYVENTAITFEEEKISVAEMENHIHNVVSAYPWLVFEEDTGLAGYAYVQRWRERASYRFSAEDSIYVHKDFLGRGIGTALLERLLDEVKKTSVHAVVAGITIPNDRSIALHEKFGFTKIAEFKEIGFKLNTWLGVGYWELIIEKEKSV
ncbi:MAG: GNAT family N-acetyltransferase [Treponema sp.]|jgi:phosphinothricin acetyltransferase|nr:GNAT family N-acetyltransferase [Treponema sp.]